MAESSARRPGLLRRLLLCPMGLCQTFRPSGDDKALWGECDVCGRRAGEVSREAVRRYADMKERDLRITAALEAASAETGAFRDSCLPPVCAAAASLDTLHPAFVEPVTAYMPDYAFRGLQDGEAEPRHVYPTLTRWNASHPGAGSRAVPVVEVEIRLRRVIQEGEA